MIGLANIVLQQIVFLATTPDSDLQPDVAIAQLEAHVHAIRQLPTEDRDAFTQAMKAKASVAVGDELDALRELEEMLDG